MTHEMKLVKDILKNNHFTIEDRNNYLVAIKDRESIKITEKEVIRGRFKTPITEWLYPFLSPNNGREPKSKSRVVRRRGYKNVKSFGLTLEDGLINIDEN